MTYKHHYHNHKLIINNIFVELEDNTLDDEEDKILKSAKEILKHQNLLKKLINMRFKKVW